MPVTHEPWLVALSLVVAIQGAYVGLSLAVQIGAAVGVRRRLLLAAAAISLAVAIWSMHFVAMLAARVPFPVDYLVFPTLLSFLVCVIVVGAAVYAVTAGPLTSIRLAASAVFMGGGIASMHYIGMAALHATAHLNHQSWFVAGSVAVGIAASGLALWLAGTRTDRPPLLLSAVALGAAIAGMHYTAMAGLTLFPHIHPGSGAPALSTDLLAIVVAVVAFVVSGVFLLLLMPDRDGVRAPLTAREAGPPSDRPAEAASAAHLAMAPAAGGENGFGRHSSAEADGPPRAAARQLPVERDGATYFVPVDDIVAVHANAHYTYVFDGTAKLFCPLAIGDVEARLDSSRFIRVHRSHIVNIDRIVGLKRAGDNGLIELAGQDRPTVPVSRSRFGWLKSQLGLKTGEAAAM
jgi:NO-binding membrane sensor protein with MHYT domain